MCIRDRFNILRFYVNYTVIARIGFAMWGFLSLWIPSIDYMKCTTSLFYVFYGNKQYETLSFFKPGFTRFLLYVRIRGKSKAEGKPWRSDKVTQILAISVWLEHSNADFLNIIFDRFGCYYTINIVEGSLAKTNQKFPSKNSQWVHGVIWTSID